MLYFANINRQLDNEVSHPPAILDTLYDQIRMFGDYVPSRTGTMKEIIGARFTLWYEDLDHLERFYASRWTREQPSIPSDFPKLDIPAFVQALNTGTPIEAFGNAAGDTTYLDAVNAQLPGVIAKLQADPASRQAVILLGSHTCHTSLQLFVRSGRLHILDNARSCHLTHGLGPDALYWTEMVLRPAAKALNVQPYAIHFSVGSLHYPVQHEPKNV
jgi:thymidylate synthase